MATFSGSKRLMFFSYWRLYNCAASNNGFRKAEETHVSAVSSPGAEEWKLCLEPWRRGRRDSLHTFSLLPQRLLILDFHRKIVPFRWRNSSLKFIVFICFTLTRLLCCLLKGSHSQMLNISIVENRNFSFGFRFFDKKVIKF